ncbi:hypothetical protein Pyn_27182 [Prunus yedoensis var. nudiflora]|uniref:Uncharacterized protein n=1 Tax=Prunus yedoensis var. nudiflora TaxID=2094558 RepID=A0A314XSV5_PRUYE|nr:hypothetical protein Pyn_27182 [Prunus yedoensis var. nudiflora]
MSLLYPIDMKLDEDMQQKIAKGVIMCDEDNDRGWTVVANHKGKAKMSVGDGRTFKEAAKGIRIMEGDASSAVAEVGKTMGNGGT